MAIALAGTFALVVLAQENRFTFTATVVNESGQPMSGLRVRIGIDDSNIDSDEESVEPRSTNFDGRTDERGQFSVRGTPRAGFGMTLTEPGFYQSWSPGGVHAGKREYARKLYARKILNPVPYFGREVKFNPPELLKEIGFDFLIGDWVKPFGNGEITDVVVWKLEERGKTRLYFRNEWKIRFPNEGDGLGIMDQEFRPCEFRSPRFAPENGYESSRNLHDSQDGPRSRGVSNLRSGLSGGYFVRIRTQLDDEGNIQSAYYGKIYGEFPNISYLINAAPNDRNLEFDLEQNRIPNLTPEETPDDN